MAFLFYEMLKSVRIKMNNKDYTTKVFLVLAFIIPFIIFAFRDSSIGVDTQIYCRDFQYIANYSFLDLLKNGYGEYELGFLIFCRLLALISKNPIVLLIGSSLLINMLFARVIYKQKTLMLVSMFTYFFLGNYLYNLNIMRQAIATGIVLNAILVLIEKKYVKYMILVGIATTFHTFAIVSLIFIPAVIFIKTKKQLVLSCVVLGALILTTLEVVHVLVLRYFSHFDYYFRNNFHADQHFGATSFAYVAVEIFTVFLIIKNYEMEEENRAKIVVYSIGLVFAAFGLIMMPRFGIYERIAKFFQTFLIVAIPYALNSIRLVKNKQIITTSVVAFSLLYYVYIVVTNAYLIVPFQFWQGTW